VLSKNIPNLEQKLDTFKTEHLHYDEEIRFMIEGGGYFDCKGWGDWSVVALGLTVLIQVSVISAVVMWN
jgi:cupin superfamily acireductone dioxygenase involved in methionine salvage